MDRNTEERLSALMDAELPDTEWRQILPRLIEDDEARQAFARYRFIGEVIRAGKDSQPLLRPGFAEAVAARLAEEPTVLAPARRRPAMPRPWMKTASGLAIAASVAMLAVYWAPRFPPSDAPPTTASLMAATAIPPSRVEGTRWETANPELERKLNRYLVSHGAYATGNGMNQVLPYASFVTYDAGR
ncbi:MAG: sigma-E factor negative regulatory protein [Gammaproteobacteria bacterium]|nr:sigma-E factor negative regulatory protein [Gammaproteobacteria bacterium]MBU1654133.1 sigma-E factor negative regulatory protein [Gammaproteobacteria bacterium]MBU1960149.1 sigma-E factor negative regulatory protein [Gammaproteobacteria bacterium]